MNWSHNALGTPAVVKAALQGQLAHSLSDPIYDARSRMLMEAQVVLAEAAMEGLPADARAQVNASGGKQGPDGMTSTVVLNLGSMTLV